MFPGLVNCTTIDWFAEWPADALFEVAKRQMVAAELDNEEVREAACKVSYRLSSYSNVLCIQSILLGEYTCVLEVFICLNVW